MTLKFRDTLQRQISLKAAPPALPVGIRSGLIFRFNWFSFQTFKVFYSSTATRYYASDSKAPNLNVLDVMEQRNIVGWQSKVQKCENSLHQFLPEQVETD